MTLLIEHGFREAISNIGLVVNTIEQKPDITAASGLPRHFTWIEAYDPYVGTKYKFFFNLAQMEIGRLTIKDIETLAREQQKEAVV